jgi:Glycosyl transferase family 90
MSITSSASSPAAAHDAATWVADQCAFWYGVPGGPPPVARECRDDPERRALAERHWHDVARILVQDCAYGHRVHGMLAVGDVARPLLPPSELDRDHEEESPPEVDVDAVRAKYGDFGAYRASATAAVLRDWVRCDDPASGGPGTLTVEHRLPILMVDAIGPDTPLIAYTRTSPRRPRERHPATLWPLPYHVNVARQGLHDAEPFRDKLARAVFRGALSGPLRNEPKRGRTSRLALVSRWRRGPDAPRWVDLGLTTVPPHVAAAFAARPAEERAEVAACMRPQMRLEELLHHRYVLCVEGADVSTAFGWVLASHCVPFHPYPFAYEVWYFRGLEPWRHFVPLRRDGSDLRDAYDWCEAHLEECEAIAEAGRAHMSRMLDVEVLTEVKRAVIERWGLTQAHVDA